MSKFLPLHLVREQSTSLLSLFPKNPTKKPENNTTQKPNNTLLEMIVPNFTLESLESVLLSWIHPRHLPCRYQLVHPHNQAH